MAFKPGIPAKFRYLLWGQSSVTFGAVVLEVALPLLAAVTLQASPTQMGLLATLQTLPWLVITLFAGVWIDRGNPRRIMTWANYGRGLLLLSIPLAGWLGWLSIEWLWVVAFAYGLLRVFFELSVSAFVPSVVERTQLVAANSQLESSRQVATVAGPGVAGLLVQTIGAPLTVLLNAFLYWISAFLIQRIPSSESQQVRSPKLLLSEVGEGLRLVFSDAYLRALVLSSATFNLHIGMLAGLQVLFLSRVLEIPPAWIGVIFAVVGLGALVGALTAARFTGWLGIGGVVIRMQLISSLAGVAFALVQAPPVVAATLVGLILFVKAASTVIRNVNVVSIRQARTPQHLLGRVGGTSQFVGIGLGSLGGIVGGLLAEWLGIREATLIAGLIAMFSFSWLFFSPIRSLKGLPEAMKA
ncbi:MFS transporter [Meiothermus ruber]|jgi:MFS family permease|uniref:Major facilitator superfamily MFS_1 n=1 Tax=Meiothermus ruber (strain ATCC 35948 / DSM 1279 / VKM B-1258 / 21) TaxID=504728 RepID=D3PR73_MEIRD|nr:MFS transporter [Meiothermus ruber]ADD27956.1 major facilitator superfamily MFS_1 [Meiothermus ruber DSM 1279]AGK04425.1 major facilitator superfamily protein [Meiothermus ruber DSM 1279]MCL6530287.1 MFS transporter [Meiothermus ruber]GAO74894.1 major facilitator superfamily protein [Meiothermus ruber H328]